MPAPIVLVHGLRGRAADLNPQREALEKAGYSVSAPDLPGHGKRTGEQFTMGESLATIAEAARAFERPPVIVGLGLGAHLAIQCASVADVASALIAIGCGTEPLGWLLDSYRVASSSHRILPDGGAALSALAATTFVGGVPRHTRTSIPGQFFDTLGQLDSIDTLGALGRVTVPVRLINGSFDLFRLQERRFIHATADAKLIRQPGVRLASGITQPDRTNDTLLAVLAQLP
jgi:pimeloyl-ACP methyl ester carboxylesterase